MTTIRVNNQVITIANKSTESSTFNIDKEYKSLESLALNIEKSIETLNIVSNIKAMESFGYKSTEGVGENIKAGAKAVWEKIKKFFEMIGTFLKQLIKTLISPITKKFKRKNKNNITNTTTNKENNNNTSKNKIKKHEYVEKFKNQCKDHSNGLEIIYDEINNKHNIDEISEALNAIENIYNELNKYMYPHYDDENYQNIKDNIYKLSLTIDHRYNKERNFNENNFYTITDFLYECMMNKDYNSIDICYTDIAKNVKKLDTLHNDLYVLSRRYYRQYEDDKDNTYYTDIENAKKIYVIFSDLCTIMYKLCLKFKDAVYIIDKFCEPLDLENVDFEI